ncbi:unnamed protein product [Closterium sp. NIES-53]
MGSGYRIQGLTREPAHALTFTIEGEGETSLVAYFRSAYGYTIRHPNLPCVMAGGGGKSYLPMEVCHIIGGQRYGPKLNEEQVSSLLRFTCTRPDVRAGEIGSMVTRNDYPNDPYAREFGMLVHPHMTRLHGRLLEPPRLVYKDKKDVVPRFGAWNMMGGQRLIDGARITHWTIVNFAPYLDAMGVQRFGQALTQRCADLGVHMEPRPVVPPLTGRVESVEAVMRQLADASSRAVPPGQWLQLAVVILPGRGTFYNEIKLIAETQLNVVTQCCLVNHAQKCQSQYLANLVLKINVKLGGRNVLLQSESIGRLPMVAERPTIVFGADVTHPSPGDDSSPSIAAVVASRDWPCANRYGCLLRTQAHRQEIIEGLHEERQGADGSMQAGGLVRDLLMEFYQTAKRKPERIIFFRDGVSEGQFYQVLAYELEAVRAACRAMDPSGSYSPRITYVVVQKRHHTRLFPADNNRDKNGNVMPGTVVDSVICHPREFDFFLNSHASIQGTSRPTHYRVLWDENNFTADSMQALCYSLCYTYARCTRSVSLVPPAYYADLAATRARLYLEGISGSMRGSGSESGSAAGRAAGGGEVAGSGGTGSSSGSSRVGGAPPVVPLPVVMPDIPFSSDLQQRCLCLTLESSFSDSDAMAAIATRALASAPVALEATRQRLVAGKALRSAVPAVTAVRGQRLVARSSLEKPTRQTYFASPQSLSYLDGTLPGDFGFDPLGLSDPEGAGNFIDPKWLTYGELINGRWAMLGVAGMIAPEILGSYGIGPKIVWFESGVIPPLGGYDYWADPYALFVLEIVLIGFAEHRRAQDYYKPGYGSKQYLLGLEKVLGGSGDPIYPGGAFFNFAGLGKTEAEMHTYKTKEVRNSRLAMLAALGFFFQAWITGVGPYQNLLDHLADPVNNNILTNLKLH